MLVTTLTKKMAEDLSDYLLESGLKVRYLHSNIDTIERIEIVRDLRLGEFDVLVGINLLREGLDLPEVSLVAILDADKEGFLRSETSLIQTMGRAARNVSGRVILYADVITDSMRRAIAETERRRPCSRRTTASTGSTRRRSARPSPTSSPSSAGRRVGGRRVRAGAPLPSRADRIGHAARRRASGARARRCALAERSGAGAALARTPASCPSTSSAAHRHARGRDAARPRPSFVSSTRRGFATRSARCDGS